MRSPPRLSTPLLTGSRIPTNWLISRYVIDSLEVAIEIILDLLAFLKTKRSWWISYRRGGMQVLSMGVMETQPRRLWRRRWGIWFFLPFSCCMWSFGCTFYCRSLTRFLCRSSALEKAESTLFVSSGMYASVGMLTALVPAGGHIVTTTDCYRKTRIFIQNELPKMGISVILHLL